jgi:predicted  nucleic acid-binding Zn-ribbon protein
LNNIEKIVNGVEKLNEAVKQLKEIAEEVKVLVVDNTTSPELESKYKQEIDKLKASNITTELKLASLMEENTMLEASLRQFTRGVEESSLSSQSKEVLIEVNIGDIFRTIRYRTSRI